MYIYGGGKCSPCNDVKLYCLCLDTLKWLKVKVKGTQPAPRTQHAAVLVRDDMYVFGGAENDSHLYSLNIPKLKWKTHQFRLPVPAAIPSVSPAMFEHDGNIFVTGGELSGTPSDEDPQQVNSTIVFDLASCTCSVIPAIGMHALTPRAEHTIEWVQDAAGIRRLLCMGGYGDPCLGSRDGDGLGGLYKRDLHEWDPHTSTWSQLLLTGDVPWDGASYWIQTVDGRMYIGGGYGRLKPDTERAYEDGTYPGMPSSFVEVYELVLGHNVDGRTSFEVLMDMLASDQPKLLEQAAHNVASVLDDDFLQFTPNQWGELHVALTMQIKLPTAQASVLSEEVVAVSAVLRSLGLVGDAIKENGCLSLCQLDLTACTLADLFLAISNPRDALLHTKCNTAARLVVDALSLTCTAWAIGSCKKAALSLYEHAGEAMLQTIRRFLELPGYACAAASIWRFVANIAQAAVSDDDLGPSTIPASLHDVINSLDFFSPLFESMTLSFGSDLSHVTRCLYLLCSYKENRACIAKKLSPFPFAKHLRDQVIGAPYEVAKLTHLVHGKVFGSKDNGVDDSWKQITAILNHPWINQGLLDALQVAQTKGDERSVEMIKKALHPPGRFSVVTTLHGICSIRHAMPPCGTMNTFPIQRGLIIPGVAYGIYMSGKQIGGCFQYVCLMVPDRTPISWLEKFEDDCWTQLEEMVDPNELGRIKSWRNTWELYYRQRILNPDQWTQIDLSGEGPGVCAEVHLLALEKRSFECQQQTSDPAAMQQECLERALAAVTAGTAAMDLVNGFDAYMGDLFNWLPGRGLMRALQAYGVSLVVTGDLDGADGVFKRMLGYDRGTMWV